jgi:hypothetical protein
MRIRFEDRDTDIDMLASHIDPEYTAADISMNCIEECEFDQWPPTSGDLQFF